MGAPELIIGSVTRGCANAPAKWRRSETSRKLRRSQAAIADWVGDREGLFTEGAKVVITGRNRDTLNAAAVELGDNLLAIEIDVTDVAAVDRAVADTVKKLGKLDIVFANAGISGVTPIGQTDLLTFQSIIGVNLTAVFFTVQAAAPHLTDRSSIILNGSVHAVIGVPGWAAYAATKGAVRAMTRVLASEFAPRGIRNQGRPSCVNPDGRRLHPMLMPSGLANCQHDPLGRIRTRRGRPRRLFLASEDSSNITAAEVVVDGGATGAPLGAPAHKHGIRKH